LTRVLVTGATGFVGRVLCGELARCGYRVRAAVRDVRRSPACVDEPVAIEDIGARNHWLPLLRDVDSVIHLAARAHVLGDSPANFHLYREVNAEGTHNLATQAANAGIRRFILLSSVKVNGDSTEGRGFSATDEPRPTDAYGESKWAAEKYALAAGTRTGMEVAIVRPPLIYGPGVKANFLRLMRWVDQERMLPFGAIVNRRSLVSIWNLCDLVLRLIPSPVAPRRVWMVSDSENPSTPELIRGMARSLQRRERLLRVSPGILKALGSVLGLRAEMARLCGSLVVDISETRRELGWSPPISMDEGLLRTARWYLSGADARAG
jgi:nucleoside-diphosphate-sugar epimerase